MRRAQKLLGSWTDPDTREVVQIKTSSRLKSYKVEVYSDGVIRSRGVINLDPFNPQESVALFATGPGSRQLPTLTHILIPEMADDSSISLLKATDQEHVFDKVRYLHS